MGSWILLFLIIGWHVFCLFFFFLCFGCFLRSACFGGNRWRRSNASVSMETEPPYRGSEFDLVLFSVIFLESMKLYRRRTLSLSLFRCECGVCGLIEMSSRLRLRFSQVCCVEFRPIIIFLEIRPWVASTSYVGYESQRLIIVLGLLLLYSDWCFWTSMCLFGWKSIKTRFWFPKFLKILLSSNFTWWFADLLSFTRGMSSFPFDLCLPGLCAVPRFLLLDDAFMALTSEYEFPT